MAAKHIATYPLYGTNPITGAFWHKRVGTGYINKPEQVEAEEKRLRLRGHPFNIRWRNQECYADYIHWLESKA
jgi:hypothetical protein